MAIILRNNTVTGGITYRPFHSQHFAEIAFCAVTGPQQVRGFGTRLMNYTKVGQGWRFEKRERLCVGGGV